MLKTIEVVKGELLNVVENEVIIDNKPIKYYYLKVLIDDVILCIKLPTKKLKDFDNVSRLQNIAIEVELQLEQSEYSETKYVAVYTYLSMLPFSDNEDDLPFPDNKKKGENK